MWVRVPLTRKCPEDQDGDDASGPTTSSATATPAAHGQGSAPPGLTREGGDAATNGNGKGKGERESTRGAGVSLLTQVVCWAENELVGPLGVGKAPMDEDDQGGSTWEAWNRLRMFCEHNSSIGVALGECLSWVIYVACSDQVDASSFGCLSWRSEITADLPSREVLRRWLGEPVKAIILPTSIFLTNRKGFPVLSKASSLCAGLW
jgi:hypothetical protein